MTVIALVAAVAALVVALTAFMAVTELFVAMDEVRSELGFTTMAAGVVELLEEVTKVVIGRDPKELGITPGTGPSWYVLFVSTHCRTCRSIVKDLAESPPMATSMVVVGASESEAASWMSQLGVRDELVDLLIDPPEKLFREVGAIPTPTLLTIIDGEAAFFCGIDGIEAMNELVYEKYIPPRVLELRSVAPRYERREETQ